MWILGSNKVEVGPAQAWASISGSLEASGLWGLGEMPVLPGTPGQVRWPWVPWWPSQPQGHPLFCRR